MLHPQLHAGCWYDGCHGDASGVISRGSWAGTANEPQPQVGSYRVMATFFYVRVSSWKRWNGLTENTRHGLENVHGDVEILRSRVWRGLLLDVCAHVCFCVGAVCGIVAVFAPVIDHSPQ